MKTFTSIMATLLLCCFVTVGALAQSKSNPQAPSATELKDQMWENRTQEFSFQKEIDGDYDEWKQANIIKGVDAKTQMLPYYNYKGIQNLEEAKLAWIADNPQHSKSVENNNSNYVAKEMPSTMLEQYRAMERTLQNMPGSEEVSARLNEVRLKIQELDNQ